MHRSCLEFAWLSVFFTEQTNKCEVAAEEVETNMSRHFLCACEALLVKVKNQQKL